MADVNKYVSALLVNFTQRNGKEFAQEIALPFVAGAKRINRLHTQLVENIKRVNARAICMSVIRDVNLSLVVTHRLSALAAVVSNDYPTAYKELNIAYSASIDYLSSGDGTDSNWFSLPVVRISDDIRILAGLADKALDDAENTLLRESITTLTRGWTLAAKDRTPVADPTSKKRVLLALTNILFKIYFTLNSLSLCTKLINIIEGPGSGGLMTNLQLLPVCDVVMFKYYHGRLMMFEDKYEDAREYLRLALRYCPRSFVKNRQRILATLVPVEMCLGIMPSAAVASQYGLVELVQLANAVKRGDIRSFDMILEKNQVSFIRVGIFLVLEQVRSLTLRNFFKRIYAILDTTRISLEIVEPVLRWLCPICDMDQLECYLANLIFQGKVKGYMSHQKKYLIVSKANPFPTAVVVKK